jgi:hypothetical protein
MVIAGYNLLRQVGEQHTLTENQGVDSSNLSLGTTKTRLLSGFFAALTYSWVEIRQIFVFSPLRNECLTRRVSHSSVSRDVLRWLWQA